MPNLTVIMIMNELLLQKVHNSLCKPKALIIMGEYVSKNYQTCKRLVIHNYCLRGERSHSLVQYRFKFIDVHYGCGDSSLWTV